jgi:two-component system, OmpR family, response regulator
MARPSPNILVVEDDRETRTLIAKYLRTNACNVATAADGREMVRAITDRRVDLLILDVILPGEDGLSLCRKVRAQSQTPIIMLTARGEDVDRIMGLEMGADDYLPKPFHLRELLARVRSVLRRAASRASEKAAGQRQRVRFAGWALDLASRELLSPTGEEVRLTTGEFELLAAFVNHASHVLSRDRLLDLSRHREAGPFDRTIDVQVGRLRRKLGDDSKNPTMIKTVRGGGYMFTPTVEFE